MLTGNALNVHKARMLRILDNYAGIEARESQLVTDAQYTHGPETRADDIRQALGTLKDDGYAARRVADLRGIVWKITPDGHAAAARIALEE